MSDGIDIDSFWRREAWPAQIGIYHQGGLVSLLDVDDSEVDGQTSLTVTKVGEKPLAELVEVLGRDIVTSLGAYCECEDDRLGMRFEGGGGSHGVDGYVAAFWKDTGRIRWLVYLNENEFEKISFVEGCVVAENNLWQVWKFPLENPEAVTVDTTNDWRAFSRRQRKSGWRLFSHRTQRFFSRMLKHLS